MMLLDPKLAGSKIAASATGFNTFAAMAAATNVEPTAFLNWASGLEAVEDFGSFMIACVCVH